jgi:hypothetical protein
VLTTDCPQVRFDFGDSGSTHQIRPIHNRTHQLQLSEIHRDLNCLHHVSACNTTKSDTAQSGFNISQAPDQDRASEGSCHKMQYYQVLQSAMKQSYRRRSYIGKRGLPPFSPSRVRVIIERKRATDRNSY